MLATLSAQDLEAGSAFSGALIAGIAVVFAYRLMRLEIANEQRRIADSRLEQASKVAAWITNDGHLIIRNGSDLPVVEFEIRLLFQGTDLHLHRFRVVPPGGDVSHPIPLSIGQRLGRAGDGKSWFDVDIETAFVDAMGRAWQRDANGQLTTEV